MTVVLCIQAWAAYGQSPGGIDLGFGTNGWLRLDLAHDEALTGLAPSSLGGWVILSNHQQVAGSEWRSRLVKVDASGSLDLSWGQNGMVELEFPGVTGYLASDMARWESSGFVVLGGGTDSLNGKRVACLQRFLDSGLPDSSFGSVGMVKVALPGLHADPYALDLQNDGKAVFVGMATDSLFAFQRHPMVCRLLPNGEADSSFGGTGKMIVNYQLGLVDVRVAHGSGGAFQDVVVLDDGRILCVGSATSLANLKASLVVLKQDGTLDSTFFGNGIHLWDINPGYASALHQALDLGGGVVGLLPEFDPGLFAPDFYYHPTILGQPLSFPTGAGEPGFLENATAMSLDSGGHVLLCGPSRPASGGISDSRFCMVRMTAEGGEVDTAFGMGGWFLAEMQTGESGVATALGIEADGRVVLGGKVFSDSDTTRSDLLLTRLGAGIPLETHDHSERPTLLIFPTPADEYFHIQGLSGTGDILLLDLHGRVLGSWHHSGGEVKLQVDNIPSGAYVLDVKTGRSTQRFKILLD